VVITAMRKAEYSPRLLVRLFETSGEQSDTVLSFHRPVRGAQVVNFLENPTGETASVAERTVTVSLRGFEIKTLLIE
jgi:alpha-mannosidase